MECVDAVTYFSFFFYRRSSCLSIFFAHLDEEAIGEPGYSRQTHECIACTKTMGYVDVETERKEATEIYAPQRKL